MIAHGLSSLPLQRLSPGSQVKLRQVVADGAIGQPRPPDYRDYRGELKNFYESQDYALAWVEDSHPTRQALELAKLLTDALDDGLSTDGYDGPTWSKRIEELNRKNGAPSEAELIDFDAGFTAVALRYVSDRYAGRANPQNPRFELAAGHEERSISQFLKGQHERSPDVAASARLLDPVFPSYVRLIETYRLYRSLTAQKDGLPLSVPRKPVDPGDVYADTSLLRRRLLLLGDLSAEAAAGDETHYEGPLVKAVKRFQRRHGLEENGKLDARTLIQLNVPLSHRAAQLRLTLERWRWLPHDLKQPPLVVNIPEFRLHADDEHLHWTFFLNVVVGKSFKRKTPVFESRIGSVIFRPYWNIPKSIQREELVPDIEQNPNYLRAHDEEVVDQEEKIVSSGTVDRQTLQNLASGLLSVRQRPGPNNSLGLVKFSMPNENEIYLHDTPVKELFSKKRRDFSHGCIRVEDPAKLAAWVLRKKPEWTPERIRAAMAGSETISVSLPHPIPVLIVYGTAVVMEDGEVRFFDDIYGYDKALKIALESSVP